MSDAFAAMTVFSIIPIPLDIPVADTFVPFTSFGAGQGGPVDLVEVVSNEIVVETNGGGRYLVSIDGSFGGSPNIDVRGALFKNGFIVPTVQFVATVSGDADKEAGAASDIIRLVPGDVLDVRLTTDSANKQVDVLSLGCTVTATVRDL